MRVLQPPSWWASGRQKSADARRGVEAPARRVELPRTSGSESAACTTQRAASDRRRRDLSYHLQTAEKRIDTRFPRLATLFDDVS